LKESNKTRKEGESSPMNISSRNDDMMFFEQSNMTTPAISNNSSKTDLSDVGLCSLNVHETNFNIMLCHLMSGNYVKALERLSDLVVYPPKKYSKHFFLLRGLVLEQIG
jgi:hypothetical protein